MKTIKVYKIGLAAMVILNIVLVSLFVQDRPPRRPNRASSPVMARIIDQLQLDEKQQERFAEMAKTHQETLRRLQRMQKELVREYLAHLKEVEIPEEAENRLLDQIQALEVKKVQLTYNHLNELKGICSPSQSQRFAALVDELSESLLSREKAPPPPR